MLHSRNIFVLKRVMSAKRGMESPQATSERESLSAPRRGARGKRENKYISAIEVREENDLFIN